MCFFSFPEFSGKLYTAKPPTTHQTRTFVRRIRSSTSLSNTCERNEPRILDRVITYRWHRTWQEYGEPAGPLGAKRSRERDVHFKFADEDENIEGRCSCHGCGRVKRRLTEVKEEGRRLAAHLSPRWSIPAEQSVDQPMVSL